MVDREQSEDGKLRTKCYRSQSLFNLKNNYNQFMYLKHQNTTGTKKTMGWFQKDILFPLS